MFSNDVPTEIQRCRVFNIYVIPTLQENKAIFDEINKNKNHILFTYDFRKDKFDYNGVFDLKDLHNKFIEADEDIGISHYKSLTQQLSARENDGDTNFYIAIFHYGAKGYFHPSLYKYEIDDIKIWEYVEMMGEPEEHVQFNPWFSNKILKHSLDWDKMGELVNLFDSVPEDSIAVMTIDNCREKNKMYYYDFKKYLDACNKALVPLDMQQLMKDEYEKGKNLMILNMINYLEDYFLLARVNKQPITGDKYTFTFISSPGDTSLNEV